MAADRQRQRLQEAARAARDAEARGDDAAANEAWRRYRLIQDTMRDPDELLAEGIALSAMAVRLAATDRRAAGRAIADGYRRTPQEGDDCAWSDADTAAMIAEEPW
jgi:negative regulator of sigma E activity